MYEGVEMLWQDKEEVKLIEKSKITPEIYNEFVNKIPIDRSKSTMLADRIIVFLGFIFDIYFQYDFIVLKREDYINKIIDKFNFEDEKTKIQMESIRKIANKYIETRNKG